MYKRGGACYEFQKSVIMMGRSKDLTEGGKSIIIKEIAKGKTPKAIAEKISHHVVTVKRFLQNPSKRKSRMDRGVLKSVSKQDMNRLKRSVRKLPGSTSATIFEEAGLPDFTKTIRNRLLRKIAAIKSLAKRPPLTSRHKRLRMEWSSIMYCEFLKNALEPWLG